MKKRALVTILAIWGVVSLNMSEAGRMRISTEEALGIYTVRDIEYEIRFGREMSAVMLADYKLMDEEELHRYVNLVGHAVLQHSARQDIQFHFAVIKSPIINAYAAPGGYIFLTSGALDLMRSEAELAGVLAHEIAHVSQRHIVKALKIKAGDDSLTGSVGQIVGGAGASASVIFDQAVGLAVEILFSKGLERKDEYEADEVGIVLTALAGYDPTAYYEYLTRIRPYVEQHGSQLEKTHPPMSDRLKRLRKIMNDEGLNELQGYINTIRFEQNYLAKKE